MWFRRLEIHDLRNLEDVGFDLEPGLNYFFGANGAGKTAILEAVHLLARGRSFRGPQPADLIRRGQSGATVHAVVDDEHRGQQSLGVSRARAGRAELRINGQPGRRLSQAAELLPLQVMVPSLSDLVFGAPSERRQWLDWGLFHVEHNYLRTLRDYLHAVRQRNAALKAAAAGGLGLAELEAWTAEMARTGEAVSQSREAYLRDLAPEVTDVLQELAPEVELDLSYRRGWPAGQTLRKVLGESVPREVKLGASQSGPHRADVDLRASGSPAGASLSRGQGKSVASALMLAQARLLRRTARRSSVFLIDDIGAELDLPHAERFFRLLGGLGAQILATSSSGPGALAGLPDVEPALFHVEHGQVRRMGSNEGEQAPDTRGKLNG